MDANRLAVGPVLIVISRHHGRVGLWAADAVQHDALRVQRCSHLITSIFCSICLYNLHLRPPYLVTSVADSVPVSSTVILNCLVLLVVDDCKITLLTCWIWNVNVVSSKFVCESDDM